MPVKKRRTGALAMASIVDVERKPGDEDAIKAYNALMLEAWVTVQAHATFKNIVQEEPKEISAGGVQTPFNQEDFTTAIRTHGHYKCGVNLAWVNFFVDADAKHSYPHLSFVGTPRFVLQAPPEDRADYHCGCEPR